MLEPNIYALWGGKQTAKGTPQTAPTRRFNWAAGDFAMPRDDGREQFSDLTKYGAFTDWVNSLTGNGEPGVEATPTELAWLLWVYHGAETVAAVTGPPTAQKHTFVPSTNRGHWATFFKRIGLTDLQRHQFNDCLIGRMQIEGSTANKAIRATPRILSLDPGETKATDPAAAMPADRPFLYTEGQGVFTIDGAVYPGHSAFTFTIDEDLSPVYGDDVIPFELVQGTPSVALSVTLYLDAAGLALWNKYVYGATSPPTGTKPIKYIPAAGSYLAHFKQRNPTTGALNGREFKLTIPSVKWTPPEAPGPNMGGGATEITMAGEVRGTAPIYTIDVNTDNAVVAFTA